MPLQAGLLRHRVELQSKDTGLNSAGEQVDDDWTTFATVWAAIAPVSARQFVASEKTTNEVRARITIRYRSDVDSTIRIKHGSTVYSIEGVLSDVDSGKEYLTLPVTAGLNNG